MTPAEIGDPFVRGLILGVIAVTTVTGAYLVTGWACDLVRVLRLSSQRARNGEFLDRVRAQEEASRPVNESDVGYPPAEASDSLAGIQIASRSGGSLTPPDRGASNLVDFRAYWREEQRGQRAS